MAMRQPIKNAASAMRGKPAAKAHVGDGLEAILQNNPQLRRLVLQAKDRGSVTFDQLNAALPPDFPPEQTEEVIQLLDAQGIMVLRDDAGRRDRGRGRRGRAGGRGRAGRGRRRRGRGERRTPAEEELGRTDDPVRMYLREMGTIELLSREGEIEIAKRIEAGRNTVLEALVREPADHARRDRLARRDPRGPRAAARHHRPRGHQRRRPGRGGVDGRHAPRSPPCRARERRGRRAAAAVADRRGRCRPSRRRAPATADGEDADEDEDDDDASLADGEDEEAEAAAPAPELLEEEDFDEDTLSLSALENKLRDGVLETFDGIAEAYRGLRELQEERLALIQARREVPAELDRDYQAARSAMVELMQQVSLNQSRVEALVQQLFDVNKHLQSLEGKLLRLATSAPRHPRELPQPTIWATSSTTTGSTASRG